MEENNVIMSNIHTILELGQLLVVISVYNVKRLIYLHVYFLDTLARNYEIIFFYLVVKRRARDAERMRCLGQIKFSSLKAVHDGLFFHLRQAFEAQIF